MTVGGRTVGTVSEISLNDQGQAEVEMNVEDEDITPLHQGTKATIRASSLSGIANRYVTLNPGPNDNEEVEEGGVIGGDDTAAPVDLDQLFNTLDAKTRRGLQRVIEGQGTYFGGRSKEYEQALKYLAPTFSTTSQLTKELTLDSELFNRFLVDTSRAVGAISERSTELEQLVGNAGATAEAIGSESAALDRALAVLPDTLRKGNTTLVNLRGALDDLDPLVAASKPATKDLDVFFRRLRPLVADAEPTIRDLRQLIRLKGRNNDLIDFQRGTPGVRRRTRVTFPDTVIAFSQSLPVVNSLRQYTPDLASWLTKFGSGAANYDANGHFARVQPIFSPFSFNDSTDTLTKLPANSFEAFEELQLKRCPGGAMQPTPDGSAPWEVPPIEPGTERENPADCDVESSPQG